MTNVIDRKIVGFHVREGEAPMKDEYDFTNAVPTMFAAGEVKVDYMHEKLERPVLLQGSTYKIKTPLSEHAVYVTINDVVLNKGKEYEARRPYEIFINTKNADHFQWIVALTRVISAVFRKGGDVVFLVEELRSVFDPRGGYFKPGGKFMPSLVAEIGDVIETHLRGIGLLEEDPDNTTKGYSLPATADEGASSGHEEPVDEQFPSSAILCPKCLVKALVMTDGCETCLNCGESKCG